MTCKDCIHFGVCWKQQELLDEREFGEEQECCEEASRFIVPPCKVGDTLYLPISHRVIAYEVSKIKYDGDLLKIVTHNKLSGMQRTIWSMDVGRTIFLSREDAEKALKERSDGK